MSSFDDILKKGKDAVASVPSLSTRETWKHGMGVVISWLQYLNEMYKNDDSNHNITVELENCDVCGKATYLITAYDIEDHSAKFNFSSAEWKSVDGRLQCPQCKGK